MPDKRTHRGAHPEDRDLFSERYLDALRTASEDLCWMLTRGYSVSSALKLVGDRHQLTARQRMAVFRSSCSDQALAKRRGCETDIQDLHGRSVALDGFNILTTVEAALAGGVILRGRDGCCRDLSSVHGSYRKVDETVPAILLIGAVLANIGVSGAHWWLDTPVSNSGRLRAILEQAADEHQWPWVVDLAMNPDAVLKRIDAVVVTADAAILDVASGWVNLASHVISSSVSDAWVVDLFSPL